MEVLLAAAVGLVVGWLLGRSQSPPDADPGQDRHWDDRRRPPKPTRRQREILATLTPDPAPPSITELMHEEAAATGVDRIPDAGLPLPVRLRVWQRDRPALECTDDRLRFVVDGPVPLSLGGTGDPAAPDDAALDRSIDERVRLVCMGGEPTPPEPTRP